MSWFDRNVDSLPPWPVAPRRQGAVDRWRSEGGARSAPAHA